MATRFHFAAVIAGLLTLIAWMLYLPWLAGSLSVIGILLCLAGLMLDENF